ncbi:extracellular superoxide dismutase [Grus japonensis]|uniref:Superoxide dismutase [Cu-Zn] n=1 Tax=Grus japonensis TaxID=30415 RepID=A0ABC9WS12_GRUJA
MLLVLSLVTGLALSASDVTTDKETDPSKESFHDIEKKVNDLWQNLLYPVLPGDFGNFFPKEGKIRKYKTNLSASMFGPYSIMGRSVVIHEQEDDMGKGNNKASLENGNAGKRLACCVIGICKKNLWEEKLSEVTDKKKRGLNRRT